MIQRHLFPRHVKGVTPSYFNPNPISFGYILHELRVANDLSTPALEDLSGVSRSYITRIEHGERDAPKREIVEALAKGLELKGVDQVKFFLAAGLSPWPYDQVAPHIGMVMRLVEILNNDAREVNP